MQLRYPIQIQSMIKALTDVVLPAVSADNKLAQEQARLVIGTLALMAQQLPLQYDFDRDELARLIAFARQLHEEGAAGAEAGIQAQLAERYEAAADVLKRAQIGPNRLLDAIRALRAAIASAVTAGTQQADVTAARRVQAIVLASCKEQLLRDRSWLRMQNWEPDPAAVAPIEQLIAIAESSLR